MSQTPVFRQKAVLCGGALLKKRKRILLYFLNGYRNHKKITDLSSLFKALSAQTFDEK